jgi:RNA-directed DNA polymerase
MEPAILYKWLKAGFVDKQVLYPTEAGVPQGGIASPVIANLALDRLERLLREYYPPNTRRAKQAKVNLVRYADDFIITGISYALLEQEVKPLVEPFCANAGSNCPKRKPALRTLRTASIFWANKYASTRGN